MKSNAACALILCLLLTGCTVLLTPIPVTHVPTITFTVTGVFPRATNLVIHDQASWQNLWTEMTRNMSPAPSLPAIDFEKDMALVASAGESTGLSIAITGAGQSSSGEIVVDVTITHPGKGCFVPQVITTPVDIATIPRSAANIVFKTTIKEHNCS